MKVDRALGILKNLVCMEPHFVGGLICNNHRERLWTFYINVFHFKVLVK